MDKTMEKRKAEALEEFNNTTLELNDGSKVMYCVPHSSATRDLITELLAPVPTDEEVSVAVIHLTNSLEYTKEHSKSSIVEISIKDAETLIRKATQPSCDDLVQALEYARSLIQNALDDGRTPRGFLCSDGGKGLEPIKQALEAHRKGEK